MKTLRFTTMKPLGLAGALATKREKRALVRPLFCRRLIGGPIPQRVFIDGEAEKLAGYDIPVFIDGDILQLYAPKKYQKIIMLLPGRKRYRCVCSIESDIPGMPQKFLITLK